MKKRTAPKPLCSQPDCLATVHTLASGLCQKHWTRQRRHGSVDAYYDMRTRTDPVTRFWGHVDKSGDCWLWTASRNLLGYGEFNVYEDGRDWYAHRFAYEQTVGPIPDGLVLDHLCRNPSCVNPDHLEAVTQQENILRSPIAPAAINARKTHCLRGHEFTSMNTRIDARGGRRCRACCRMYGTKRRAVA